MKRFLNANEISCRAARGAALLCASAGVWIGGTSLWAAPEAALPGAEKGVKPLETAAAEDVDALGKAAMAKGLAWLKDHQKDDGSWSAPGYPGLSALGLWAAARSRDDGMAGCVAKAADFVAKFAQEDGGIYKPALPGRRGSGGLSTYNTAICMMALYQVDPDKYAPVILKAREYVASSQLVGDSAGNPDEVGGFGYNKPPTAAEKAKREAFLKKTGATGDALKGPPSRPDMSNTGWALMAMRMTEPIEDRRPAGEKKADIQWESAVKYIASMQNMDASDADSVGSFGYERGGERGGTSADAEDKVTLRGFGSMTYDGLEAMIYAKVDRKDPKVRSAAAWAARHWTVEENPGMGLRGLFYYYVILTKAIALYTQGGAFVGADGAEVDWRGDLIRKLAATQAEDGSWANSDNTFWEADPALVTAYSLLALETALGM